MYVYKHWTFAVNDGQPRGDPRNVEPKRSEAAFNKSSRGSKQSLGVMNTVLALSADSEQCDWSPWNCTIVISRWQEEAKDQLLGWNKSSPALSSTQARNLSTNQRNTVGNLRWGSVATPCGCTLDISQALEPVSLHFSLRTEKAQWLLVHRLNHGTFPVSLCAENQLLLAQCTRRHCRNPGTCPSRGQKQTRSNQYHRK